MSSSRDAEQSPRLSATLPVVGSVAVFPSRSDLMGRYLGWVGRPFCTGWPVVIPLLGFLAISGVFRWTNLDLWISAQFYDPHTRSWPFFYSAWCTVFYRGGVYPAFALAVWSVGLLLWGLFVAHRRDWLRAGCFLLLVFALGPGLIVNTAFKQHWGRPRPHQLTDFGGQHEFAALGSPGKLGNHNSSFPSGHAAVAFYLMAPAFIANGRRPRLANGLLAAGLAFGACMSATRVMQGGHFASDVFWSAGILYFTSVTMARLILRPRVNAIAIRDVTPAIPLPRAA